MSLKHILETYCPRPTAADIEEQLTAKHAETHASMQAELTDVASNALAALVTSPEPQTTIAPSGDWRSAAGGRLVKEQEKAFEFYAIQAPNAGLDRWRTIRYTEKQLLSLPTEKLIDTALEMVPAMDKALYDWAIFCNPGYEIVAEPVAADRCCKEFIQRLDDRPHENFSSLLNQIYNMLFAKGGVLLELVLDPETFEGRHIAIMEPETVSFKWVDTEPLGPHWEIGQWKNMTWEPIYDEGVKFIALRPERRNPSGRAMISSSVLPSIFMLVFVRELREVIRHQGYPRLDIEIISELVRENAPDHILGDPGAEAAYMQAIINQIDQTMKKLEPRDVYIDLDDVKMNAPVGTTNHQVLAGVDTIIDYEMKQIIQGLKTMSVLLGHNDTTTETYATREWEIYMAAIRSAQDEVASVLEQFLKIVCQAAGIQAKRISFKFRELRDSEALRYAQVDKQNLENLQLKHELIAAGVPREDIEKALSSGLRA